MILEQLIGIGMDIETSDEELVVKVNSLCRGRVCPSASCHSSRYSAEISQTSFHICPVDRASSLQPASTSKMRPASVWLLAAACHVSPGYEYHVYLGPRSGEPVTNFWQSTGAELDT